MTFSPRDLYPLPDFSWQPAAETPALIAYRHFYRLDKAMAKSRAKHCFGKINANGLTLAVQAFLPENARANVFVLHGYTDHVGLFDQLIEALLANHFNVVALDLPGHGLTESGHRAGIDGFGQYQDAVKPIINMAQQQLGGDWFLIGQSTGGAIAMDYILNNPEHHFKKVVLLAPLVIPVRWGWVKVQLFALRAFLNKVPRTFSVHSSDRNFLQFLRKDPLQTRTIHTSWVQSLYDWQAHFEQSPQSATPTLLIQGEKDVVVDWQYNMKKIEEKFTALSVYRLSDANHHLVNEDKSLREAVFKAAIKFIKS